MALIPLSKGMVAKCDDEDFERLSSFRYYAHTSSRGRAYAARKIPLGGKRWGAVYMHHDVMGKPASGLVIDHIDGDSLNNSRSNLRACSQSENVRSGALGQMPGVFACKQTGRFGARVRQGDRRVFLGRFDTFAEAASAVMAARKPAHGPVD